MGVAVADDILRFKLRLKKSLPMLLFGLLLALLLIAGIAFVVLKMAN